MRGRSVGEPCVVRGGGSDIYSWRYCGHDEVLFSGRVYVRRRDGNFIDLGGDVPMGGSNALSALYLWEETGDFYLGKNPLPFDRIQLLQIVPTGKKKHCQGGKTS